MIRPAYLRRPIALTLGVAALVVASARGEPAPHGPSFAVRAGAIYSAAKDAAGPIVHGVLVVRDGKIEAVGADLAPPDDLPLIDLPDAVLCPGFVSAGGLGRGHSGPESTSGAYRAADGFDTYADYPVTLSRGTTTAYLTPGEQRLVSGVGAVVKLGGPAASRVLVPDADLAVNLGVFDPPPLYKAPFYASADVAIQPSKIQRPDSRLGALQELRERFDAAAAWTRDGKRPADGDFDAHLVALSRALEQKLPVRISARAAVDVRSALTAFGELQKRGLPPRCLVGLAGGDAVLPELKKLRVPLVVRIEDTYRNAAGDIGRDPDALDPQASEAATLTAAGLQVALAGAPGDMSEDLRLAAIFAVRAGMEPAAALAGITRVPAEILGLGERIGSLEPGKDADFLVLSAAPLDTRSFVRSAYVGGERVFESPRPRQSLAKALTSFVPPPPDPLVVRAGRIWTGDGTILNDAEVLIEKGKVASVGYRVPAPPRARFIDAGRDAFVVPGFVDAHGHLGLDNDRSAATPDLPIHQVVGAARRDFERVARAGVTTVLLSPYRPAPSGARVAAIKTYGADRAELVARETSGVEFSLLGKDPQAETENIRRTLEAAKRYDEQWKKYADDLKKWREGGAKPAEKPKTDERLEAAKVDPITGVWKITLSGDPLPQPVDGEMKLRLNADNSIEGRITDPTSGEEAPLTGTLVGDQVKMEVDVDTPLGKPTVTATLDKEDHMLGKAGVGNFSINFDATRTDKGPVEFKVTRQRKRSKDGGPTPPKIDENLEGLRLVLQGKAAIVVEVDGGADINAALKLIVDDFKLPVVLVGSAGDDDVLPLIEARRDNVGIVPPPALVRERFGKPYNPATEYSRRGVRVALQSNAEDGARSLPAMAFYAAREGMGGDAALKALTIDAARMYKLDDRIGSIAPGRDGDLLIFSGHPFDAGSRLERVIVGGREVPGSGVSRSAAGDSEVSNVR